jgi:hypothetical protein
MAWTEADEAARGEKSRALANLAWQVRYDETMGVIAMYERAALKLGATLEETKGIMRANRSTKGANR